MNEICAHCRALMRHGEPKGMCYSCSMSSFRANQIIDGIFMLTVKIQVIGNYQGQASVRQHQIPNLNSSLLCILQNMLHSVSPDVNSFIAALESIPFDERNNHKFVITADKTTIGSHPGHYNASTTIEVAFLLVNQECDRRDIVLCTHYDRLHRITETHRASDCFSR